VWSSIAKNATGFIQQAVEATGDIVQIITTPEEEAIKFPRGNFSTEQRKNSDAQTTTTNKNNNSSAVLSNSSRNSSFSVEGAGSMSRDSSRVSSRNDLVSVASYSPSPSPMPMEGVSPSTSGKVSPQSMSLSSPAMAASNSAAKGGGAIAMAKKLPVEENDDFFGSFGLK
jgi:hypothetical protein